jgi:23S rRNA (guanosine2251-2'-O)-methyltransferase
MRNLIYGFHSVTSYLKQNPHGIDSIYLDSKRNDKRLQQVLTLAAHHHIAVELVVTEKLNQLLSHTNHQGIIAKVSSSLSQPKTLDEVLNTLGNKPDALVLILDGITDPQNLGAIIRSADCFGVDAVIIPKDNSASVDNPVVAKVSSGAIYSLPVLTVNNINRTMDKLKEHEFWIAGTSLRQNSINLFEFKFQGKLAWVMGNEGSGIRRLITENCDYLISIPMLGQTQSLNVSVATGVVLAYTKFMQEKLG